MTFEINKGNLFDPDVEWDALAQGVNCQGKMGAGIAVEFKNRWPAMYTEYKALCDNYKGYLPGTLHIWVPNNEPQILVSEEIPAPAIPDPVIYNLFSQWMYGPDGNYQMLASATVMMRQDAEHRRLAIVGLPWIGCGIAGLERHNVRDIFEKVLGPSRTHFTLVQQ